MRSTKQMSITLPHEMARMVKDKVAAGEYATESEVIRDGLRALLARERAVNEWLKQQVGPAYDAMQEAMQADGSRGVTPAQVRARLMEEQKSYGDDS